MPPPVTVLMTVYNGSTYLPQAVESVLNQTFTDFEFLIIDDGSTDESVACIRSYGDSRIRLVCNESNLGQAGSLNRGLELARGKYIARMDQDDICLPDRLQKQVDFLDRRPDITVVATWIYMIDSDGRKTGPWGVKMDDYGTFVSSLLMAQGCPFCHPSIMFRREAVSHVGGYDETFAPCEDFELWVRLAMSQYKACIIPEPLLMFRLHKEQQSLTKMDAQRRKNRRAREKMIETFCNGHDARLVSLLLRMDGAFWKECHSKGQVRFVLEVLDNMLKNLQAALKLAPQEFANLTHRLYRWLGGGARIAILGRHRQSLPVYLFALRGGLKMMRYPSILFYPLFYILSPLLVPKLSHRLLWLEGKLRRLLYPPWPHPRSEG